nr:putative reverse transcriptase domain-containing protein [Tanacetum cinerariifolium]
VPIPSESEDTSGSNSECDLLVCDDFSPIDVPEEKSVTFFKPLFDSNDDFTSSDDESLSNEDVQEDNVKIYSNPLFEFDDEYISYPIDQSPPQEMSIQDMELQKQQRECEINIYELKDNFNKMSIEIKKITKEKELRQQEQAVNLSTYTAEPSRRFNFICYDDDDEEKTIPLRDIISQLPPDVNPLFDEVLEDIESKDSYDSNFDESALLVTPLFDSNKDECFDPGGDVDEINAFDIPLDFEDGYYDSKGDVLYFESLLSDDTTPNLPLEVFLDHDLRSLNLSDELKDFVVYFDASGLGLGYVLMQRASLDRAFSDYDYEIRYHPSKANVVVDALGRKEIVKPERVRAINMTLQSSIKDRILAAQKEACDESTRLQKAHKSKYSVQPGAYKMYYDLRDRYWGPIMKKDIAVYVRLTMDFVMKLLMTSSGHDTIWVIIYRLTKSAYFLLMREDYKMDRLARLYLNEIVARHEIGEGQLIGPELVQETTEKISQIKDRLKATRHRQKSYADKRRKPLEFSVGDYVLLKVSPWKGVVRFGKKEKLAPKFVGPFEIIEKVGPVAYRHRLPEELNGVHDTFHVSNLKKCLADSTLQVPLDELQVDAKLNFVEQPVEILEKEFKKLKRSRIASSRFGGI